MNCREKPARIRGEVGRCSRSSCRNSLLNRVASETHYVYIGRRCRFESRIRGHTLKEHSGHNQHYHQIICGLDHLYHSSALHDTGASLARPDYRFHDKYQTFTQTSQPAERSPPKHPQTWLCIIMPTSKARSSDVDVIKPSSDVDGLSCKSTS